MVRNKDKLNSNLNSNLNSISNMHSNSSFHEDEEKICRICLCPQISDIDPLISPCMCSGSMKFIHIACLYKWLSNKGYIEKSDNFICFNLNLFICELCKEKFHSKFRILNSTREINIYDIEKPNSNYFVCSIKSILQESDSLIMMCIFDNKTTLKFGRGKESEIRFKEISLSRCHCKFSIVCNSIIIEDTKSKYGTFVKATGPIQICPESKFVVQIGNSLIKANYLKEFTCCKLFPINPEVTKVDSQKENEITNYFKNFSVRKLLVRKSSETPRSNLKYIEISPIKHSKEFISNDISGYNSNVHIKDSPSFLIDNCND